MKKGNLKKRLVICAVILLFFNVACSVGINAFEIEKKIIPLTDSNTLYVGGSGPGNYSTIQDAVDDAVERDTVFVYDDSSPYYENVVVDISIRLKGENTNTTIIDGSFWDNVIKINDVDEVSISKFTIIHGSPYGIFLENSLNSMIANCKIISNNGAGMHLSHSSFNTLMNLTVSKNDPWGVLFNHHSNNNIIINCNISDNGGLLGDGVGIYLSSWSSYNQILNSLISNNGIGPWNVGILLEYYANHTFISNCTVSYDGDEGIGICFGGIFCSSNHNKVLNCNISGGGDGISCLYSSNNTFINNQIWSTTLGVSISSSSNMNVINCNLHHNTNGVSIYHSSNNTVLNCNISNNDIGLRIQEIANNNTIYHNNFFNNVQNAYDECNNNFWDKGYPSGGNYWDDYEGDDENRDGIGDIPYDLPCEYSTDWYPLMQPYKSTVLELEVGNKVILRNIGDADAYATSLIIEIKGGLIGLIDKTTEHMIGILPVSEETVFGYPFIFGLGRITITISAIAGNANELTAIIKGFAIGPFIFMLS